MSSSADEEPRSDPTTRSAETDETPEWTPSTPAEALRANHSWRESRLKSLGRGIFGAGIWFLLYLGYFLNIAYLASRGEVLAPWIFSPYWFVQISLVAIMTLAALAGGLCLWNLRDRAREIQCVFLISVAAYLLLASGRELSMGKPLWALAAGLMLAALLVPMRILLEPEMRAVLSQAYREAIAETPRLRVKARTPWRVKLLALGLLSLAVAIASIA